MSYRDFKSYLFVPLGNNKVLSSKAYLRWASSADVLILDLEDSLPKNMKATGRENLSRASHHFAKVNKNILVRVNRDENLVPDIDCLRGAEIKGVVVPKVETGEILNEIRAQMGSWGQRLDLMPLLETPRGIINIHSILHGTSEPPPCLFFGPEDLATQLGVLDPTPSNMMYSAQKILLEAAALGIPVVGTIGPFRGFRGSALEDYKAILEYSLELGFSGFYAIHPYQLNCIHDICSLKENKHRTLNRICSMASMNRSVFDYEGEMFGPPMLRRYSQILRKRSLKKI